MNSKNYLLSLHTKCSLIYTERGLFGHVPKRAQFTIRRTGQTINTDFPLSGHFDYRPFDIVKGHINIVEGCGWAPPWSYKYFFFYQVPTSNAHSTN